METGNQYSNEDLRKDMQELKIENRIQTIAVLLLFFFGIATIHDIVKRSK